MLEIPGYINLVFILTVLVTYVLVILSMAMSGHPKVRGYSNLGAILILLWLIFQSTLSLNKWFMDRTAMPPHMLFPLIVSTFIILLIFLTSRGKKWSGHLSLPVLVWIHAVRIPVELCLYWLAAEKQLPNSMTFEGYNFDIFFGITAPIVAILYFNFKKLPRGWFMAWNVLGLISVMAVVIRGIGALPSPVQLWDFEQPNYAVMHFPFIWLPAFVVPVVIFSHILAIRKSGKVI